jgi:hypothetical protein
MTAWRYWLVELPARITEVGLTWYRLYMFLLYALIAVIAPVTVIAMLVLWFGFGIRWGW